MEFPISVGDQQAYHNLVDDATGCLETLSHELSRMYNELDEQPVDVTNLGSAAEAILFAIERLKEQKIELESYRKSLRKDITSSYDTEEK